MRRRIFFIVKGREGFYAKRRESRVKGCPSEVKRLEARGEFLKSRLEWHESKVIGKVTCLSFEH